MAWFDWLRKVPAPVIVHPVFGRVRAAHRPANGSWSWETLESIRTPRGKAIVNFDAGEGGPSASHEAQWANILAELDRLTAAAAPLIARELEGFEVPFDPAAPWSELTWEGADLCGDTKPSDEFALAYACKSWPDAMITVCFENGQPTLSRLDD
jgi:hypothetical protein